MEDVQNGRLPKWKKTKMLLIKQIKYNDEVTIGVIDIKEVDTKKEDDKNRICQN